jgi:hypothetical protein
VAALEEAAGVAADAGAAASDVPFWQEVTPRAAATATAHQPAAVLRRTVLVQLMRALPP